MYAPFKTAIFNEDGRNKAKMHFNIRLTNRLTHKNIVNAAVVSLQISYEEKKIPLSLAHYELTNKIDNVYVL